MVLLPVTFLMVLAGRAQTALLPTGDTAAVDYSKATSWVCRPGVGADVCSDDLDALRIDAKGARTAVPYRQASVPGVDCFYVYPTTSDEPTFYSGPDAEEWVKK